MSSLFLSYRRADSQATATLLHEKLKARLPRWQIFYDHQSIQPGEAFPERLRKEVTTAEVIFVIIGPDWLRLMKERRSLPVDHVHEEIKLALAANRRVVPVLVQNAAMPSEADLTDFPAIVALPSLNAKQLRPEPDFGTDLDKLIAFLEPLGPSIDIGTVLGGNYKLVSLIGEGGMGIVYKAHQLQPKRDVAVKLIKPGMDSKEVLARFAAERQALAVMNHPNIAKVLEAGATAAGRPFFVMELVKGVPITQYCDDKKLTPNDRLKLLRQVCDAVQHAHQKGIIHRDIKPTNVLVETIDGQPVPKVIDFGLAKALDRRLTDASGAVTQGNTVVGTLLYSSPEQAAGKTNEIDTRTDIYSLGALLYELLVGEPPFTEAELKDVGELAMTQRIIEKEPSKPSAKLSSSHALPSIAANRQLDPAKLTRQVRGELDWIVMKALEKEPDRRYATATSLGEDLEHYLNHEPITAGRPSAYSRVRKFVRRNRVPVIAGCVVFLVLILGIVGTTLGIFAAKEAEGRANENAEKARLAAGREKDRADEAEREKKRGDDQTQLAAAAATREKARADEALREKQRAEMQLTRAEKLVYSNSIQTAQRMWNEGLVGPAFDALNSCRWDYRGWEHDYLHSKFNQGFVKVLGYMINVTDVDFSPDGKLIVSGSRDNKLKIWDAMSGQNLFTLSGHTSEVSSVSFSPDSKRIVSGSYDNTLKTWDVTSGEELLTFKGHSGRVMSVSFSPDGKRIVSGSWDNTLKVWDVTNGQVLLSRKHTGHDYSVGFSPDSKRIFSLSYNDTFELWDATSGQVLLTFKGHSGRVMSVAFSPDGKRVVSGSEDKTLKVWDTTSGQELLTLKGHMYSVRSVIYSPDGKRIVSGDGTLKVWDAMTGVELLSLAGHSGSVCCISFSLDGRQIFSASTDGTVHTWDSITENIQLTLRGHTNSVCSVAFAPDDKRIVSGSRDHTIKVWDAVTGQEQLSLAGHKNSVVSVSFSPDGKRIASGSWDNTLKVWDAITGNEQLTLKGHKGWVNSVSFSPDGKRIVSGSWDNTLKVWDAITGDEQLTLEGHAEQVMSVMFSPDGKRIASESWDNTLKVWDSATGEALYTIKGEKDSSRNLSSNNVSFSRDGKRITSGSIDDSLKIWDVAMNRELSTLKGYTNSVTSVSFSPDSKRIVSGNGDSSISVWDAIGGQELLILKGHTNLVNSVSFSSDGRSIVSGSDDKTLKVWNVNCGEERLTLQGNTSSVNSVSFSPDGKVVYAKQDPRLLFVRQEKQLEYGYEKEGKILAWNASTGRLQPDAPQAMPKTLLTTSPDGKLRLGIDKNHAAYVERLDNRGPDGLTPQQRWDRERLAKWAAWNPTWHTQQAEESEKAEQWFAAAFHLRLLVKHAPNDAALAARLIAAEAKLNAPKREAVPPPREAK